MTKKRRATMLPEPTSASELLADAQKLYQQLDVLVSENDSWLNKTDPARMEVVDALESAAQLVDFLYIVKRRADPEKK